MIKDQIYRIVNLKNVVCIKNYFRESSKKLVMFLPFSPHIWTYSVDLKNFGSSRRGAVVNESD